MIKLLGYFAVLDTDPGKFQSNLSGISILQTVNALGILNFNISGNNFIKVTGLT
jgi:hypothetical protein